MDAKKTRIQGIIQVGCIIQSFFLRHQDIYLLKTYLNDIYCLAEFRMNNKTKKGITSYPPLLMTQSYLYHLAYIVKLVTLS